MKPSCALDSDNTDINLDWQASPQQTHSGYCVVGLGLMPVLSSVLLLWDLHFQDYLASESSRVLC